MKEYSICKSTITFAYDFSKPLEGYHDVISRCSILRFENVYRNGRFGSIFNLPIELLPRTIKIIEISFSFNSLITLPKHLVKIIFNHYFDQEIELPKHLEYLSFGTYFNKKIYLPPSLKCLKFSDYFNQPIILPNKLIELELGRDFNQPIVLPNTLMYLKIGYKFTHKMGLSESLIELIIDCNNNGLIENLPNSLNNLITGFMFFLPFETLPNSIDNLIIHSDDYDYEIEHLKGYVKYISVGCDSGLV